MPTYDYECEGCGHTFELFQSITARAKRKPADPCEGCGERAPIRRLIGAGGAVIFKGNGFYETDYRSESYKKAAKADKDGQSGNSDKAIKSDGDSKKSASGGSKETASKADKPASGNKSSGSKNASDSQ